LDLLALHEFVMKVSVFLRAVGPSATLEPQDAELFSKYAEKLSEQGLFETAAKYSRGDGLESKILRDRLYRSQASPNCLAAMGGSPPEFPFSMAEVKKTRASITGTSHAAQQQQSHGQQESNIPHQSSASYSQQYQQKAAATAAQPAQQAADAVPAGWMALQDPSSGNTYYANQTTGEVTWELPQAAPAAAGTSQPTTQQQPVQQQPATTVDASTLPSRLASKYGDGFVTSASHPELASQYGNVGTR
jgi:protein transport protein SEC31